jgi:hypothetical protein
MNQFRKLTIFLIALLALNAGIPSVCLCQHPESERAELQYAPLDGCCSNDASHCGAIRNCSAFSEPSAAQAPVVRSQTSERILFSSRAIAGADHELPLQVRPKNSFRDIFLNTSPIFQPLFLKNENLRI